MNTLQSMRRVIVLLLVIFAIICGYIYSISFKTSGVIKVKSGVNVRHVVKEASSYGINSIGQIMLKMYIAKSVKMGNYTFARGEKIIDFAKKVRNGESDVCTITFVPGKTIHYYKQQLDASNDFSGQITVSIPEGYIFPDTYTHKCQTAKNTILLHAQKSMEGFLSSAVQGINFQTFYLHSPYEVLIMASIIEKETGVGGERERIAAVFKNRLKLGMRLQTDPTVIYQESQGTGELGRGLTRADLKKEGLHNTYVIKGLPPTPIASPSKDAIIAAINPSEDRSLYFVATGNGGHNFSQDYLQHMRYIQDYKKVLKTVPRGTEEVLQTPQI